MAKNSSPNNSAMIPVIFVLTLFLILSAMSCMIIIQGSGVYQKLIENMDKNYETRVTFSYISTKIRQSDKTGYVMTAEKDGVQMLGIKEEYSGEWYVTYVYYYDGYIREIMLDYYNDQTIDFNLSDGDKIIKSNEFTFNISAHRIEMSLLKDDGTLKKSNLYLRSSKE